MQRIKSVDPLSPSASQATLKKIHDGLGATPAMFRITANSPAVLNAMWAGFGAAASGKLKAALVEKISVAVSNVNKCEYCLSAHTFLGTKAGATASEMAEAVSGKGKDARETAAIRFGLALLQDRGFVSDEEFAEVKEYFSDEETIEIIHVASLTNFTNAVNNALRTPNDFPVVNLRK